MLGIEVGFCSGSVMYGMRPGAIEAGFWESEFRVSVVVSGIAGAFMTMIAAYS